MMHKGKYCFPSFDLFLQSSNSPRSSPTLAQTAIPALYSLFRRLLHPRTQSPPKVQGENHHEHAGAGKKEVS